MMDTDQRADANGVLHIFLTGVLVLILYAIGQRNADDTMFFLLSAAALVVSVPLLCAIYPASESGRHYTLPRAGVACFVSLAGIALTTAIGYLFPEQKFLSPVLIGGALLLGNYARAR